MDTVKILEQMGISAQEVSPFQSAEDGSDYEVWKVETNQGAYVLKKAKGEELAVYSTFFPGNTSGAPDFLGSVSTEDGDYFLMPYVEGESLLCCTREKLKLALDALIDLQKRYWECRELAEAGFTFEKSLVGRKSRGEYLKDRALEEAYEEYLKLYSSLPRTLCHDDLLPFNVLVSEETATIIDWEYAGLLPYPTSLARLIAHGEEGEGAFFFMKEEDKSFAIDYYYEHLVKEQGIGYTEYRKAVNYFLLYEYCEWIMLGNKYEDADRARYERYLEQAATHLKKLAN